MEGKKTPRAYTEAEIRGLLGAACAGAGSVAEWARRKGVHRQLVYDVLAGKPPGGKVLERLGFRRREREYEEV